MHAMYTDPRRLLMTAMAALILALGMTAVLGELSTLSFTSADGPAAIDDPAPIGGSSAAWVKNPLQSPVVDLRTPTAATP